MTVGVGGRIRRKTQRRKSKQIKATRGRKKDNAKAKKHQEMNCIQDVELDTTVHSTTFARKSDASSGTDAMLRGAWTRIGGRREDRVRPGSLAWS